MESSSLSVSEIWIYPVKSLGGIRLKEALLSERGLKWDRRWMLLNEKGGFMTQRQIPSMAWLEVSLQKHYLEIRHRKKKIQPLHLPFDIKSPAEVVEASVWDDTSKAIVLPHEVNKWFSHALGQNCSLVHMPEESSRTTTGKTSGRIQKVSFADAYPVLMTGQASLDDLNKRLTVPVPMNRFRPNLVFTGGEAYEEDSWHAFTAGGSRFWAEKPCSRCVLTTVDQDTAKKGKEPLATLAKYRNFGGKIMFGQNLLFEAGGTIKTGDKINVLSHKEGPA